jgi:cytochrome c oxidase subunit 2
MPTYQGQISEDGVIALVEYIKNLNSNYRIEQTLNTTDLLPEGEVKSAPAATGPVGQPAGQKAAPKGMVKQ